MKYQFIEKNRSGGDVRALCDVLNVSHSTYYAWRTRSSSKREEQNQQLLTDITLIHRKSRQTYGSPRITQELRSGGKSCGENRVARIMRNHGIRAKTKRQFRITTTKRNFRDPVAENLVKQQFVAERPNQLWSSDITYLWTREGWLYLAVVLDVYSRQIVGYALSTRLTTELVSAAFIRAVNTRAITPGLILHSDQGCQYTSTQFQQLLKSYGIRSSMSARGNCYDNAITETFFHTLKTEHIYLTTFETRTEAELSLFDYIEIFYNRQRIHSSLGYKSTIEFEKQLIIS